MSGTPQPPGPADDFQTEAELSERERRLLAIIQRRVLLYIETFSGPLPPPDYLRAYDDVLPGLAAQIVEQAAGQTHHRQTLERKVVEANIRAQERGQWFAFLLGVVGLIGSFVLVSIGRSIEGMAGVVTSIAALAGVAAYFRREQERERKQKRAPIDVPPSPPQLPDIPPGGPDANTP